MVMWGGGGEGWRGGGGKRGEQEMGQWKSMLSTPAESTYTHTHTQIQIQAVGQVIYLSMHSDA